MTAIDPAALETFKTNQKLGWAHFAPLEAFTTPPAARLVRFAGVRSGQRVLDVACGTGVAAVTAALLGAKVSGLDLTPELLARARENSAIAGVDVDWREGDAEALPFGDGEFDVVVSQYGHMFAPRPDVAVAELLRVLKPGGTIAFSTWPPQLYTGRMFALVASFMPPPPAGVSPPGQWGDPNLVRERLGSKVRNLTFDHDDAFLPALSIEHALQHMERTAGPVIRLVAILGTSEPAKLEDFRRQFRAIAADYWDGNRIHQTYLLTRAIKA